MFISFGLCSVWKSMGSRAVEALVRHDVHFSSTKSGFPFSDDVGGELGRLAAADVLRPRGRTPCGMNSTSPALTSPAACRRARTRASLRRRRRALRPDVNAGARHSRGNCNEHLDDLASGDAEIFLHEIGAPDAAWRGRGALPCGRGNNCGGSRLAEPAAAMPTPSTAFHKSWRRFWLMTFPIEFMAGLRCW